MDKMVLWTSYLFATSLAYSWKAAEAHLPQAFMSSSLKPRDCRRVGSQLLKKWPVHLLVDSSSSIA